MKIKAKKQNADGIVRLETSGQIREVMINEDFLKPKDASVSICFRGKSSSGIVEMDLKEIDSLYKSIAPKINMLRNVKVMKFDK